MIIKTGCFLLIFFSLCFQLSASGRQAEAEKKTQNDEWILCITNFDVSSLPEDQKALAGIVTRRVVNKLNAIGYRTRVSPEYAYYEEHAWVRSRNAAARALSAKYDERSLQLFRGDPSWRYRQNLERIDAEIEKLKLAYEEIDSNPPLINNEPVFKLTSGNLVSNFPAAPREGNEYRFCTDQRADAFLAGSITDFHGRYYVSIKLYTVYTRSFVWEDGIVFSAGDLENAVDEMSSGLMAVLSGKKPAALVVRAQPQETLVLINQTFAGRGETQIIEQPPGMVTVTASAPDYETVTKEIELVSGMLTEVNVSLNPLQYSDIEIPGSISGGSVYHGSLYAGEAPLTLRLPVNVLEYLEMETLDGQKGSIVFQTPQPSDSSHIFSINTSMPPEKGRVDKARSLHYWAWGGTWITGIAAWIAFYTYTTSDMSLRSNYAQGSLLNENFLKDNTAMYYVSMGTVIAVSAAALTEIFLMGRYIYMSNKGSTSVVITRGNVK
ncbi:MAG: PEGA domain-containing protein [Treponema sp.]|nr:PEGA domain-containing protein [Treponema sp.]